MIESAQTGNDALPPPTARRVDQVCNQFERAWGKDPPPRIEDFLGDASGEERLALLCELVPLDVDYRRQRGEKPTPWPELACVQRRPKSGGASDRDGSANGPLRASARPVGILERGIRWVRRRPAVAVVAVCLLAALALLGSWLHFTRQLQEENAATVQERNRAREQEDEVRRQLESNRHALFSSQLLRIGLLRERDPNLGMQLLMDADMEGTVRVWEAAFPALHED